MGIYEHKKPNTLICERNLDSAFHYKETDPFGFVTTSS